MTQSLEFRVTGMDCPSCATKIEDAVEKIAGVRSVRVSIASSLMTVDGDDAQLPPEAIARTVEGLGYKLFPLDDSQSDDEVPSGLSPVTAAYRRALWIVVLLNLGYGAVEIVASVVARSQALQADALDFMGDGLISLFGLLAVGWSLIWRARSALAQGIFLAVLGLGVLGTTAYRVLVLNQPEAELMGVFGAIALIVNVVAAAVLIPHRAGDANVRAVWLFSRNDAIGNAAVIVAAGFVAWTGTAWPDLIVAFFVAGLFLHSAWSIIADARADLRRAAP